MSMPPLHLADIPVVGHDGSRRNVTQLYRVMAALIPRGRVVRMDIAHDEDCPCADGPSRIFAGAMDDCTCTTVDVTLSLIDPRLS